MSKAGWYPDPGGQQGMFRWWDGSQWTPQLTATPWAAPPQADPTQPFAATTNTGPLPMQDSRATQQYTAYDYASDDSGQQRSGRGPLLVLGAVVVLLVALVVGSLWLLGGGRLGPLGGERPASNPTADICPRRSATQVSPTPHVNPPGRVQGGRLSYPQLGDPWGSVLPETRVPFGSDVYGQSVMIEPNYDGRGNSWVAALVVGELVAGDGFFSPEQGAEIVTRCVLGVFYGDAEVDRTDRVNQATTVDGREAWLVEMHLTFDIPNLKEKGETAIIMVVATGTESSSLYYASIPDSRPDLLAVARQVQGQLKVEG
ncbi:MAG TPA: DUF2510 domain-containing protein [Propionibacterium sp.]|nr:DUF2510 domain-containing protein [Propionibacterium sp.]